MRSQKSVAVDASVVTPKPSLPLALRRGWTTVRSKYKPAKGPGSRRQKLSFQQILLLIRRVIIIAAAVHFVYIEFAATNHTLNILRHTAAPIESFGSHDSHLLAGYLGSGLIRDSPLITNVLDNTTIPRSSALYLWSETQAEFEQCEASKRNSLYSNASLFPYIARLMSATAYNMTFMRDLELVAPVIDCSFEGMIENDVSITRFYMLSRSKSDHDDVYIISIALSIQEYEIPEQSRKGPAFLGTITYVNDVTSDNISIHYFMALDYPFVAIPVIFVYEFMGYDPDGSWILRSIPRPDVVMPVTTIYTVRRRGFYFKSETDQSNIVAMYRKIRRDNPLQTLTRMEWFGQPSTIDSWAWVHGIHFIFGMQTLFSVIVLFVIMFRNWQHGKIWIGDAFSSVSSEMLITRMILVMISWLLNDYWVLTEYALSSASKLSGTHKIPVQPELATADMLVLTLGLFSLIGWLAKERIDPALGVYLYVTIHANRLAVIRWAPSLASYLSNWSDAEYLAGIVSVSDIVASRITMRLWTTYKLKKVAAKFLFGSFYPKLIVALMVIGYATGRRIYHHYHPAQAANPSGRRKTAEPNISEGETVEKSQLTIFEVATGALLRSRFGLISNYNNYVFIKGMRYASADGIYCSGYVIANRKFLVATDDIFAIVLMKLLRSRLYNVYVYEVDGSSVQQMARLVYPDTLSWKDVTMLNTSILS